MVHMGLKMKNGQKWTLSRIFLYETFLVRFGPYDEWGDTYYPKGRKDEFWTCLEELALHFSQQCGSEITASAVHQQFKWAITSQDNVKPTQIVQFLKNKVAAHEIRFIRTHHLPSFILLEKKLQLTG